jgi:hypothetical protein
VGIIHCLLCLLIHPAMGQTHFHEYQNDSVQGKPVALFCLVCLRFDTDLFIFVCTPLEEPMKLVRGRGVMAACQCYS